MKTTTIDFSCHDKAGNSVSLKDRQIEKLQRENARMREVLKSIVEGSIQQCGMCEGAGKKWADGKAHYQSYRGPTIDCPNCGGSGSVTEDADGIAEEALKELEVK